MIRGVAVFTLYGGGGQKDPASLLYSWRCFVSPESSSCQWRWCPRQQRRMTVVNEGVQDSSHGIQEDCQKKARFQLVQVFETIMAPPFEGKT